MVSARMIWSVCTAVCVLISVSAVSGQSLVVNTRYGLLRGSRTAIGPDSYVDKFFKIPFAKPPVGNLRFHNPEAPEAWTGTRDATQPGAQCPQQQDSYVLPSQIFPQSEDCLFLNVFTPKVSDPNIKLPVMVWLHGGGFYLGTGNRFDWTQLAANGVVVVAINYRLSALGFLSTEDGASPGNYGLQDQIRALEWVRDVISAFNGDPSNVTIFGESAGGSSVSLLVLSRETRGLFHRAIMESGVSSNNWAVAYPESQPSPKHQAAELATRLGCDTTDTNVMVDCLRTKDAMAIRDASIAIQQASGEGFSPVAETTFGQYGVLSATPEAILRNNWFNNVPTIRGFNHDEAAIGMQDDNDDGFTMAEIRSRVEWMSRAAVAHGPFPMDTNRLVTQLMDAYFITPNITDHRQLRQAYIQLRTDLAFAGPILREVGLVTDHNVQAQFVYRFDYRSSSRLNEPWKGVQHVDEVPYVTGAPVLGIQALPKYVSNWTDDDIRLSRDVMTMWVNFAKYGDPTPSSVDGAKWLPWTQNQPKLLQIGRSLRMINDPVTAQQKVVMRILSQLAFGTDGVIG